MEKAVQNKQSTYDAQDQLQELIKQAGDEARKQKKQTMEKHFQKIKTLLSAHPA